MEKKWTEGPWGKESFALSEEILAPGNKLVAIVQSRHCDRPEEMRANAHLIAAAPDLYEGLENLCQMWVSVCSANGWDKDHLIQYVEAIAALAKARGETGERRRGWKITTD